MRMTEFARDVIGSEAHCVKYLRKHDLFNEETITCRGRRGVPCGSEMHRCTRKSGVQGWICKKKKCRTRRSVRTNMFFTYEDKNGNPNCKLSLSQIMSIVDVFLMTQCTIRQASHITGCSLSTVVDWYNMCREVCSKIISSQP